MKRLLLLLSFAGLLSAQTTVFYTWNIQSSPVDAAVAINTTQDGAVAGANFLLSVAAPGTSPSTITKAQLAGDTTFTLASVTGLQIGNGLCFSPSASNCAIVASIVGSTFTLTTGEVALVTAIAGNVVTVKRASIGTAATYSTGQSVSFLKSGSYSQMAAWIQKDFNASIITNAAYGSASALAAVAAHNAANAALKTAAGN